MDFAVLVAIKHPVDVELCATRMPDTPRVRPRIAKDVHEISIKKIVQNMEGHRI